VFFVFCISYFCFFVFLNILLLFFCIFVFLSGTTRLWLSTCISLAIDSLWERICFLYFVFLTFVFVFFIFCISYFCFCIFCIFVWHDSPLAKYLHFPRNWFPLGEDVFFVFCISYFCFFYFFVFFVFLSGTTRPWLSTCISLAIDSLWERMSPRLSVPSTFLSMWAINIYMQMQIQMEYKS